MMRDEPRKPAWLKIDLSSTDSYSHTSHTITSGGLHTICASGKCPNRAECWSHGTATFMIGGNYCTRRCRFCATAYMSKPPALNPDEPESVARSVREMGLRYAVVTSVDRDDLVDSGAAHWAETVRAIRRLSPETKIEVLIPDFRWDMGAVDTVLEAGPDVVGHNVETVRRLTPHVRYRATYDGSLAVLRHISDQGFIAKTGIMLGLGETEEEVLETMRDCYDVGVQTMTIGQYLRPTRQHIPVVEYIHPDRFRVYAEEGRAIGLKHVESGPLVRSSYHAADQFDTAKNFLDLRDLAAHRTQVRRDDK